ncbi:MAG: response regulator transcription factor [Proteobacteria bacterium]|nr:response regulator transcription factor [Pseudomonadota bacterium]MBS0462238.1 response regulator transcription factor [Pseudomonadota bacterium]MBS0465346.1 response regulator transcription factor [Pseudomonadota bacterium]
MPEAGSPPVAPRPHVLVVEDDADISGLLSRYLGGNGLRVSIAGTGAQVRGFAEPSGVDLVLLDLGLPDEDGLQLLRLLQGQWQVPVIVVSGRGEPVERVVGLELGADDYVAKPFDLRELLARVRSVLRRAPSSRTAPAPATSTNVWRFDGLTLDVDARRLIDRGGAEIELTNGEFQLLRALLEHPQQVLSRDQLMNDLHGRDAGPFDRAIDVQVGRLRRKIELDPERPRLVQAIRGAGYRLAASVHKD